MSYCVVKMNNVIFVFRTATKLVVGMLQLKEH